MEVDKDASLQFKCPIPLNSGISEPPSFLLSAKPGHCFGSHSLCLTGPKSHIFLGHYKGKLKRNRAAGDPAFIQPVED